MQKAVSLLPIFLSGLLFAENTIIAVVNNDIISLQGFIEGISEDKQYRILEINNLI